MYVAGSCFWCKVAMTSYKVLDIISIQQVWHTGGRQQDLDGAWIVGSTQ